MKAKKSKKLTPNFNYVRSKKISYLNYKNTKLLFDLRNYLETQELNKEERYFLQKFERSINGCAAYSLYSESSNVKYIGSHTCDHRGCNICNSVRQKRIRSKYFKFFSETPELLEIKTPSGNKIFTQNYYNEIKASKPNYKKLRTVKYSLMHLTLTVRHDENGFKGKVHYYDEIIRAFRDLRNSKRKIKINGKDYTFKSLVYGGEYGIETTRNGNGLHIHIHSLLFVRKITQSRNILTVLILVFWNNLTINKSLKKRPFRADEINNIKKLSNLIDDNIINQLDRRGATLVTVETVYFFRNNQKFYVNDLSNLQAVQHAVLETVSYHFKPGMFEMNNKDKTFDIDLIKEVLPAIHKKKLYEKFGCLYNEKSLSVNFKDNQLFEDFKNGAELTDESTDVGADYYILQPSRINHFDEKEQIVLPNDKFKTKLNAANSVHALQIMSDNYKNFINGK